jgi:tagaturonate reductase
MPESIFQFGTGKFLRCFCDLFVHEVSEAGAGAGSIVALQSTGHDRARLLNGQQGRYHVAIRGLEQGQPVDRTIQVRSIRRALAAGSDWADSLAAACSASLLMMISNTTEAGYALRPEDTAADAPPRSFPAKLLALLRARREAGGPGVTILPCELYDDNAARLRDLVLQQAQRWHMPQELSDWLQRECAWHNTLVDRIVSAPPPGDPLAARDPLFAVAEPFALWLIEGAPRAPGLIGHPAVQCVAQLAPYALRKVRILNGAHTALVAKARPLGFETVRQAVLDPQIGAWLRGLLFEEIVPTLAGRTDAPQRFAEQTLERFANPLIEHRLADIALHHDVKLRTRLLPTCAEFRRRFGRVPKRLDEVLGGS